MRNLGIHPQRKRSLAAAWLLVVLACPGPVHAADELLVFAAASLQESLTAATDAFAAGGAAKPVVSFGASSALARQIDNGAPSGLFISADDQWMDYLADRGLLAAGTRTPLLGNELVLIAPSVRPFEIAIRPGFGLAGVLGDEKLAMADPASVPAGRYGKAALVNLGVWSQVEPRVASAADVRAALALVERDEARAGIVYRTDALVSRKVVVAGAFPQASHQPIVYPLAILAAHDSAAARGFRDFLLSEKGKEIFRKFGFAVR